MNTLAEVNQVLRETGHKPLKEATLWVLPQGVIVVFSIKTGKPIYAMSRDFFSIPHLTYAKEG